MKSRLFFLIITMTVLLFCGARIVQSKISNTHDVPKPLQLFNGKDLHDWTPKIRLHEAGENYQNTFRVKDGLMQVRYDGYDDFNKQYGHIAYNTPFSYYILRVEYRFVDEQVAGGEGWAWRNSGAMLHGQAPHTMPKDQDFPISIEGQFLGGNGTDNRPTSNLCTPGTNVVIDGETYTPHCLTSSSKTYHGDQWVTADFVVLGDSLVQHILDGEIVLQYNSPTIGGGNVSNYDPAAKEDGKRLIEGYIYLQSESHPIDFRKVELYDLSPYKNDSKKIDDIIHKVLKLKR